MAEALAQSMTDTQRKELEAQLGVAEATHAAAPPAAPVSIPPAP